MRTGALNIIGSRPMNRRSQEEGRALGYKFHTPLEANAALSVLIP